MGGVNSSNHNYRRLINNQVENNILFFDYDGSSYNVILTKDMVSYTTTFSDNIPGVGRFEYSQHNNRLVLLANGATKLIYYSNDLGWTWTETSIGQVGRPQYVSEVKYSPTANKWCMFSGWNWCFAPQSFTSGKTLSSIVSSDGINWTENIVATSSTTKNNETRALEWANNLGIFVAIPASGTSRGWISSDGISWSQTSYTFSQSIQVAKWSDDINVFVAGGLDTMLISTDGSNWNNTTTSFSGNSVFGIDWSTDLSMFAAICRKSSSPWDVELWRSTDGDNWTLSATFSGNIGGFFSLSWVGSQFVGVCGFANDYMVRSSDGINWATYSVPDKLVYDIQYTY